MTAAGWDLVEAVTSALVVLGFMELPEEETPPMEIWGHSQRMESWFEQVKADRQARYSGTAAMEPIEDAPMETNEDLPDWLRTPD